MSTSAEDTQDDVKEDMLAMGATDEQMRQMEEYINQTQNAGIDHPDLFEIEIDNITALSVFTTLETQWNFTPAGYPYGLRYESMMSAMDMMDISNPPQVFSEVRDIEKGALAEWADRRKAAQDKADRIGARVNRAIR